MFNSKRLRKALCVIALQLLLTLTFTAFATDANLVYTLETENAVVSAGDTIDVVFSITENDGFLMAVATISFDPEILTYQKADITGSVFNQEKVQVNQNTDNAVKVTVGDMTAVMLPEPEQFTATGTVAVLTFLVNEDYEGELELNVSSNSKDVLDLDKGFSYVVEDGELTVTSIDEETHVHTEEILPAKAATCTETGLTEGRKCSVCGEITVAQEEIPALGHTEEVIPGKVATCTETGLTEGKKCSVCGEITAAQEEIPALGHTEEVIPGKAATCTETGLTEGKKCSVCGEVLVAQSEIPATGHGETELRNAKDATCTEEGYTGDTVCKDCGTVIEAGTVIEKTAHTFENGVCTVCGAEDPDYVPDEGDESVPQTGDGSNGVLWIVLLIISGLSACGVVAYSAASKNRSRAA